MKLILQSPVGLPMIVTQPFGANTAYYRRFGLPGHEGIDLRAPTGTPIHAAAAGVVVRVGDLPKGGAYGYHVRLAHHCDDGEFETIYGHCQTNSAHVKLNEEVAAGQVLALADATGNVLAGAAHLHFSLKKRGATASQETGYPSDLTDPMPYFLQREAGARPPKFRITAEPRLRVRAQPSLDVAIVGYVAHGDVVELVEQRAGWGRIKEPGGWIDLRWAELLAT